MEKTASDVARELSAFQRKERKVCAQCGREFVGVLRARYCSHDCANVAYRERNREDLNRKRREKYQRRKKPVE